MTTDYIGWREATERALYTVPTPQQPREKKEKEEKGEKDEGAEAAEGPAPTGGPAGAERQAGPGTEGFFIREAPGAHFRTAVHASPLFATAVARLLRRVDDDLGRPPRLTLVDVGAGRGELLTGVLDALRGGPLESRLDLLAVERAPRPDGLDSRVAWQRELPAEGTVQGLLFANEWLDNVPVDVAETDSGGVARYVLTNTAGEERLGDTLGPEDAEWLRRWWPLEHGATDTPTPTAVARAGGGPGPARGNTVGVRAEIGRPRDRAWASAVSALRQGLAVAVDYAHTRGHRPLFGTLTGYRDGREVRPVPDGSCDITSHVALDACAEAAGGGTLLSQRDALRALGVDGTRPALTMAHTDPAGYVRALAAASQAAELLDSAGMGSFSWLLRPVGRCRVGLDDRGD